MKVLLLVVMLMTVAVAASLGFVFLKFGYPIIFHISTAYGGEGAQGSTVVLK